ncbi:MAG: MFS transporter [Clostridia bacterium]|nr:MFS transporter [Clostridia bacterium]
MFGFLIAIIYLSFISLGLPDSLLGAAWPVMREEFGAPVSYAGIVSIVISVCTIASSLLSDRTTKRFGAGTVTAVSVGATALALLGFSFATAFWQLVLLAIPYGLGAGGVDAALNNYVALHLKSRHMSWLHCMWGVGAAVSPYIMGYAISGGAGWPQGYLIVAIIQICLSAVIFASLPLWKKYTPATIVSGEEKRKPLTFKEIVSVKGAVACFITFFCYCALEQTSMLWASSFMVARNGFPAEFAARFASLFFIGITVGRAVNGFLTYRFSDKTLIRAGQVIITAGIILLFIPNDSTTLCGFSLIGLGCAPIYPCIIHMTPSLFGAEKSQAMIGVQMASAYLGSCLAPPLYGLIANHIGASALPVYLALFLVLMVVMHETVERGRKGIWQTR